MPQVVRIALYAITDQTNTSIVRKAEQLKLLILLKCYINFVYFHITKTKSPREKKTSRAYIIRYNIIIYGYK